MDLLYPNARLAINFAGFFCHERQKLYLLHCERAEYVPADIFEFWNWSYLELPEDAASMSVVIMSGRNVFYSSPVSFQILLHMLKEPWLVVVANSVYLQENMHSLGNNYSLLDNRVRPQIPFLGGICVIPSG